MCIDTLKPITFAIHPSHKMGYRPCLSLECTNCMSCVDHCVAELQKPCTGVTFPDGRIVLAKD